MQNNILTHVSALKEHAFMSHPSHMQMTPMLLIKELFYLPFSIIVLIKICFVIKKKNNFMNYARHICCMLIIEEQNTI